MYKLQGRGHAPPVFSRDYLGGGSADEGAGLPSTVSISIISTRVPSGSNRPTCRLLSTPRLIFSSRAYAFRAGRASSVATAFFISGTTTQIWCVPPRRAGGGSSL